eukprot:8129065-Alexandrium_andersonii.AAC.1
MRPDPLEQNNLSQTQTNDLFEHACAQRTACIATPCGCKRAANGLTCLWTSKHMNDDEDDDEDAIATEVIVADVLFHLLRAGNSSRCHGHVHAAH